MQQTAIYEISEEYHAELHRKGIPHKNVTVRNSSRTYVEITLEFDEQLAAELYPLTAEHKYKLEMGTRVPKHNADKSFSFYNANFSKEISSSKVTPDDHVIGIHDYVKTKINKEFTNIVDINEFILDIQRKQSEWPLANAQAAVLEEQRKKLYAEQVARDAEQYKLKEEQQRAQWEEEEKREAEALASQLAWIKEHGSERLIKSFDKGYKCKKLYLLERLKHDVGNYVLDYDAKIERKGRSCPSMEALLEVERIEKIEGITEAKVVWLPYGTAIEDYNDASEGIEAKFFGYWIYTTEY